MFRSVLHTISILILIIIVSNAVVAQPGTSPVGINFILVNFDNPPNNITVYKAPLKYNKDFAFSMQIDDANISIYTHGFPVFEGGDYNGTTYPGFYYSDGCGNLHSFKMSAATYVFNSNNENGQDVHIDNSYSQVSWAQLDTLYSHGWGILNHGVNGNANTQSSFINYSIRRNRSYIRRNLYNTTEGGVIPNVFVNPNGSQPWTAPSFALGNISALNQHETFPIGNNGGDVNASGIDWTLPYSLMRRTADDINVPSFVDGLAASSTNGANYWCPIFTHSIKSNGQYPFNSFVSDFTYVANTYGEGGLDNILMTTDEEIQDYLIVRDAIDVNYGINGNLLWITFDGEVVDNLKYYSSSIVIESDAIITDIIVDGTSDYTRNGIGTSSSLINLNWDGKNIISAGELADSMVLIASTSQTQYDCWVAMDYVITMENGQHKDSLRQVLCNIPNTVYDDGFCICDGSLLLTDTTIILNDCITLNGPSGDYTYQWYIDDSLIGTMQSVTSCPIDTLQYNLVATNNYGCPASDSLMVNVHNLNIDLGPDSSICEGDFITILGPPNMIEYNWFVSDTLFDIGQEIEPVVNDTTQFLLRVEDQIGATAEDSLVINALPVPNFTIQTNDTTIKLGNCTELIGPPGYYDYSWYIGDSLFSTSKDTTVCPVDTTQYNLIASNSYGCSNSDSVTVSINFLTLDLGPDTTICEGNCVYLEGPPDMVTYVWYEDGVFYSSNQSIEPCPVDTTQYSLLAIDINGNSDRDTIQINVLPTPIVDLQPADTTITLGDSIVLYGAMGNYTWQWYIGDSIIDSTQNITRWPVDTTQYNHIATNIYGCSGEDSVMVNINYLSFDLGPDTSICLGECVTLTGPPDMVEYYWYVADTIYDSINQIINPCPLDTTMYTLYVLDNFGNTASDSITINIYPTPVFSLQNDTIIKEGACIELFGAEGSYTWEWFVNDTLVSTDQNIDTCQIQPTLFDHIATNVYGCSGEDSIFVDIDSLEFDLGPNRILCSGNCDSIIGPDSMEVYTWYANDIYYSSERKIYPCPTDTTKYLLQVVDSLGASAEDSIMIFTIDKPIVYFDNDTIQGSYNEDIELTVNTSDDVVVFAWRYNDFDTITFTNTITFENVEVSSYIYSIVQSENGCNATDSIYLNVVQCPPIIVSNNDTICFGDSTSISVSGGEFFRWIAGNDTISTDPEITVSPKVTREFIGQTAYSVDGCYSSDTVTIYVYDSIPLAMSYDTNVVCSYEYVEIGASGADHYIWMPGGDTNEMHTFQILDTTTIYLTGANNNGCYAIDSLTFYTKPAPIVSFTGLLPVFCENDEPVDLVGTPVDGTFSGSGIVGDKFYPVSAGAGEHSIVYSFTNVENCTGRDTVVTTVYGSGGEIDLGEDFTLQLNESKLLDAGGGFDSYFWTTGETSRIITVLGTAKPPGVYEYAVMGVIHGCSTRGSVNITFENPDGYLDESIQNLQIYPNPNLGRFYIKFSSVEKHIDISITNLQGNVFYKKDNLSCDKDCNIDVDLRGVPSGFYFLKIATPKGVTTAKIILK